MHTPAQHVFFFYCLLKNPPERKNNTIPYQGNMGMTILHFLGVLKQLVIFVCDKA